LLKLFEGTVTANGTGSPVDTGDGNNWGAALFLNVTAASETSPTLTVTVEDSPDGVTWYTLATFTQATGVTKEAKRVLDVFGRYLRVNYTVGGTTPSFAFSVIAELRYRP